MDRFLLRLGLILLLAATASPADAQAVKTSVIALLTDFGIADPYVAQMKGAILTINPSVRMIDLTHQVAPYNIEQGAYLLNQCAEEFPAGTIFVAVVDPQVGTERLALLVKSKADKFYLGPDNGLLSMVLAREGIAKAWKLDKPRYFRQGRVSSTFHGRDIFGPVAAYLAQGELPETLGTSVPVDSLIALPQKNITFGGGLLNLQVLQVDHYGNIITNLSSEDPLAKNLQEGDLVRIMVNRDSFSAPLVKTYDETGKGRLALLYGSGGLLEITKNQGSAAKEIHLEPGQSFLLKP